MEMKWRLTVYSAVAAVGLLCGPADCANLVQNGSFESGLSGWTVANQLGSDGSFFAQTGSASPVNANPVAPPPDGLSAAMTDAQAGGSHVLFQDITIPTGLASGTVSFSLYLNNMADR